MQTSVFVIAEIRLYREGLVQSLESQGFTVTGSAAGASDALQGVLDRGPNVVVIDMAGAEAQAIVRRLAERLPDIAIVALSVPEQESDVLACAEAGASNYVPREASLVDLVEAINAATRGEAYCSPKIAAGLLRRIRILSMERHEPAPQLPALTTRQSEILELIDQGLSNKEIAGRLLIEVPTVKNHIHNILEKLQVHRRSEAAARARAMR